MNATQVILLAITAVILSLLTKVGAVAVSAPNSSYATAIVYALFSIVIYLAAQLLGLQEKPQFFSPLFSLGGFQFLACLIGLLILKFLVTMRLFDIGLLRAFCLMIAITALMPLTTRVLTAGSKSLERPNKSLEPTAGRSITSLHMTSTTPSEANPGLTSGGPPPITVGSPITIARAVRVMIPEGEVIMPIGFRTKYLGRDGETVYVDYNGYKVSIPAPAVNLGE